MAQMDIRGRGVKAGFNDQRPALSKFLGKVGHTDDLGGAAADLLDGVLNHNLAETPIFMPSTSTLMILTCRRSPGLSAAAWVLSISDEYTSASMSSSNFTKTPKLEFMTTCASTTAPTGNFWAISFQGLDCSCFKPKVILRLSISTAATSTSTSWPFWRTSCG